MQKINIYSKSPEFIEFIKKMDSILSKTQHLTPNGKGMDVEDQHFKDQRTRLATVRLEFEWSVLYLVDRLLCTVLLQGYKAAVHRFSYPLMRLMSRFEEPKRRCLHRLVWFV